MNIIFRTDASLSIGNGHVIRCLTLATALKKTGAKCLFVCSADDGNLIDFIRLKGFVVCALSTKNNNTNSNSNLSHSERLCSEYDWNGDAQLTLNLIADITVDWIIVDHYSLDARWESMVLNSCRHLMVIDDLANRPHLCKILLDQNLGRKASDYSGLIPNNSVTLIGPRFALLQPMFSELRAESLKRRSALAIDRILITMGGSDAENATALVLQALNKITLPNRLKLTVVMGPHAPHRDQIINLAQLMKWETEVLINVSNMAELMAQSDIAIGAAGTTSWERCCLGLPTLLMVLADNQIAVANAQEAMGCAILLPNPQSLVQALKRAFSLIYKPDVLKKMISASTKITDGDGSSRVIELINAY